MRRTELAFLALVVACVTLGPTARTEARPAGRPSWEPPASIDRTGRTDVSAELQHWFARVPDGGVARLSLGATYRVDQTVTLAGRHRLEIDGNGSTLRAGSEGDRTRSHLRLDGGSDLRVHDLTIIGANPEAGVGEAAYRADREAQHAIELFGTARVQIDHVTVHDVFGDGVYIGRTKEGTFSSQVWIHDSTIVRTGRQGISVTAGRDVVIEHNDISETRRSTVDLEPNTPDWGAERIYIAENRVGPGRLRFIAAHGGGPVSDVVIRGNRLTGRVLSIDVKPQPDARRSGFWVIDNESDTPADRTPLRFERVDGLVVRGNHQRLTTRRAFDGEVGVETTDACGVAVEGNDFAPAAALHEIGPPCGPAPTLAAPPAPMIPGRPTATPAGPATTGSTTAPGRRPISVAAPARSRRSRPVVVVPILLVGLGLALVVRHRRSSSGNGAIRSKE